MARTTVNIEDSLLLELRSLQKKEGKSLGELVSEMISLWLAARKQKAAAESSHGLGARVDFNDKDALYARMNGSIEKSQEKDRLMEVAAADPAYRALLGEIGRDFE